MPYDPETEHAFASFRAKQLIVLASDILLRRLAAIDRDADAVADGLVEARILPGCFQRRYDGGFLEAFRNTLELTRNLLVSDSPFLPNTASELAAHAIFGEARAILSDPSEDALGLAASIDPRLPGQLTANAGHLTGELESLYWATVEDADVLALFSVPADHDPEEYLTPPDGPRAWEVLRFENWLVPFGGAPRPHITYDGRAWPVEL